MRGEPRGARDGRVTTEIVIVRHGQTEWSESNRHTGRTDLALTETGRRQARALRAVLADRTFSLVLCSPLRRARETCELAGFGERAVLCDDLREWDYGEYEGLTTDEIRAHDPRWSIWRDGCPGGERPEQVSARANRAVARVRRDGGDVLAFAHGHILRVLTARWLKMAPAAGAHFALAPGAVSSLGCEREAEVVVSWNCSIKTF
jgi:broad specificity phosphatase PhoE